MKNEQKNIKNIQNCYGCGVCVMACPKHIIELHLNELGFYEPMLTDADACSHCGLCTKTCSCIAQDVATMRPVKEWGAMWSKDSSVVQSCSSGGVAFELAKTALQLGYKIISVRYNTDKQRAEHCICATLEDLIHTKGSKYIQSYTPLAFETIDLSQKYLVIGTPCQIDSLRRFIRQRKVEKNFILIDFFCHGVPSYNVWNKYVQRYSKYASGAKDVAFRSKTNYTTNEAWPWHASFVVTFKSHYIRKTYQPIFKGEKDWFYHYFLEDLCLGPQCYTQCKYKMYSSSADIRIGDAWTDTYRSNEEGVSAVLTFTEIGSKLLHKTTELIIENLSLEDLVQGQMATSPKIPDYYRLRLLLMHTPLSFEQIDSILNYPNKIKHFCHRIHGFIRRHINHA